MRLLVDDLALLARLDRGRPAELAVLDLAALIREVVADRVVADRLHAFERFWRGDQSRSRNTGGSGLGLSIAAAIVGAQGGTIGLTGEPGAGTCVWFTLPRVGTATKPGQHRRLER